MAKIYKIHPAIGFARVGNAEVTKRVFKNRNEIFLKDQYKIGGKIIPVPASFTIWEHELNTSGVVIRSNEINANTTKIEKIEWRVHLANKKAAFYKFKYKKGESVDNVAGFRNTPPGQWVIDPMPVNISGKNISNKKIIYRKTRSDQKIPTLQIGSLWTDQFGSLYVFGGKGIAQSAGHPPVPLSDTFNTPTWYDDVSDGPVTVYLKFKDQTMPTPVEPSWVIVGPPDFAPPIENIVTLYDVLFDLMARNVIRLTPDQQMLFKEYLHLEEIFNDFRANGFTKLSSYRPHFHDDILPILARAFDLKYVSQLANTFHNNTLKSPDFAKLTDLQRKQIFDKMRIPPTGTGGNMPRMHGDAYGQAGDPDEFLSITKTQHELLRLWSEGKYRRSAGANSPNFLPFLIDTNELNKTVGGAFAPGIEVSWLFRNPKIYSSPFRIDHAATEEYKAPGFSGGTLSAGHLTRQLANPWHADFMACALTNGVAWWPAQRPDDVFTSSDFTASMVPWFRDSAGTSLLHLQDMVDKWHEMGFVLKDTGGGFVEKLKN